LLERGGSLKFWALLIAGAALPFLFDTALPLPALLLLLLVVPAFVVLLDKVIPGARQVAQLPMLAVAIFVFTSLSINQRLNERLPANLDKSIHDLSGVITGLPETRTDQVRFLFLVDTDQAGEGNHFLADSLIRVSWHIRSTPDGELPVLRAGEQWQLPLQLRTTRAPVNFVGADAERWAFSQGIAARAYVLSHGARRLHKPSVLSLDAWRETVLEKIQAKAGEAPALRLLIALAVADRRDLTSFDRQTLTATGTGHLLAISGLHIGLAAVMGFYFGRALLLLMFTTASLRFAIALPWVLAWLSALTYAALAGFGVSTQRALIMLSVATLVILSRRTVHPAMAWLMAMGLVLLIDPIAPLRAGFWFSFIAVGILLLQFSPRFGVVAWWQKALQAQFAISLIMAPLGMYWFQQTSLPGLLANLVAIPLVSFVTVPLILVGLLMMWLPGPLAGYPFYAAGYSIHLLLLWLQELASWQPAFMMAASAPSLPTVLLAMLGAAIVVMPRGLPGRALGVLLMLPLLMPVAKPLDDGHMQVDMLDVGQGLAVLAGNRDYLMLYDTGPGNGLQRNDRWDTVNNTIEPAIAHRGIPPDLIVVSHADLDHAGGLASLQTNWPDTAIMGSFPNAQRGIMPCRSGQPWSEGIIRLQVLHPAEGLPYLGNDSSCVISMQAPGFSLLLTGDISKSVENRLGMQAVPEHHLMTVAHHGSAGSSSSAFIKAVRPQIALISAEANNRFGFPRIEVMQLLMSEGIQALNTADCGGIRITSLAGQANRVQSARQQRDAIWRFKADDICP
jgi:competence protein ComEC